MAGRPRRNPQTQLASVAAALIALETGKARSKTEAAEIAGTSQASLSPARLALMQARNPRVMAVIRQNPLEITAEVAGQEGSKRRVSMREALSQGAERCVALMAELAPKVGTMTKEEERSYLQAARWLQMCRSIGLFGENEGATLLPSELRHEQPTTGTPEHWQQDDQMKQIGARMLTVIAEPEGEILEDEPSA